MKNWWNSMSTSEKRVILLANGSFVLIAVLVLILSVTTSAQIALFTLYSLFAVWTIAVLIVLIRNAVRR